jgi:hypothetical protein
MDSVRYLTEPVLSARARLFGPDYTKELERIRRAIPESAEYLLVNGGPEHGQTNWVRYDLLPRRCRYLGQRKGLRKRLEAETIPLGSTPYVVVCGDWGQPARLFSRDAFLAPRRDLRLRQRDERIPANIDRPAPDALVHGLLEVAGWCQEEGGRPCQTVSIWIDDDGRDPLSASRFARPDVEAVVPGIGKADRAGYVSSYRFEPGDEGEHSVSVTFVTEDGRFRQLGPVPFRWAP